MSENTAVVLGAGLTGSLLSIFLVRRGYDVKVIEKRSDLRKQQLGGGRSINLALSRRGKKALRQVGLDEEVNRIAIPMKGRMMHNEQGALTFQSYGKEGQAIYSVSRTHLNKILLNKAEEEGVKLLFDHTCTHIDLASNRCTIEYDGITHTEEAGMLFGADGAFSRLRGQMQRTPRYNYSQEYIDHGYKELDMPPAADGSFAMEPHALHIWPRGKFMLIALPNPDCTFTCTLFYPYEGEHSFEQINSPDEVEHFFRQYFPDLIPLMPDYKEQFFEHPTSSMVTIRCYPWSRGNNLLIGDAAHAILPFYGQGMNAGFEDCHVLDQLIGQHNGQWEEIIGEFQQLRKPDADAIAQLAADNFVEMRDFVADPAFLRRKEIESELQDRYPNDWLPLYSMVTFSDMRYSEALHRGIVQREIMDDYMRALNGSKPPDYEAIIQKLKTHD